MRVCVCVFVILSVSTAGLSRHSRPAAAADDDDDDDEWDSLSH